MAKTYAIRVSTEEVKRDWMTNHTVETYLRRCKGITAILPVGDEIHILFDKQNNRHDAHNMLRMLLPESKCEPLTYDI